MTIYENIAFGIRLYERLCCRVEPTGGWRTACAGRLCGTR
jgi:hypothetical protein